MSFTCGTTTIIVDPPDDDEFCDPEKAFRDVLINNFDGAADGVEGAYGSMGLTGDDDVCWVTSRDDSGPGTLRECLSQPGRYISFHPDVFPRRNDPFVYFASGQLGRNYWTCGGEVPGSCPDDCGDRFSAHGTLPSPVLINLLTPLTILADTTIDGRGAHVRIANVFASGNVATVSGSNVIIHNVEMVGYGRSNWDPNTGAVVFQPTGHTLEVNGSNVGISNTRLTSAPEAALQVNGSGVTFKDSMIWNTGGRAVEVTGELSSHGNTYHNSFGAVLANGGTVDSRGDYVGMMGLDGFEDIPSKPGITHGLRSVNGGSMCATNPRFQGRRHECSLTCYADTQGGNLDVNNPSFSYYDPAIGILPQLCFNDGNTTDVGLISTDTLPTTCNETASCTSLGGGNYPTPPEVDPHGAPPNGEAWVQQATGPRCATTPQI